MIRAWTSRVALAVSAPARLGGALLVRLVRAVESSPLLDATRGVPRSVEFGAGGLLFLLGLAGVWAAAAGYFPKVIIVPSIAAVAIGASFRGGQRPEALVRRYGWDPFPWWRSPATWLILSLLVLLGLFLRTTPAGPVLGVLALAVVGMVLARRLGDQDRFLAALLFTAFFARLIVLSLDTVLEIVPKSDAAAYDRATTLVAGAWWQGEPFPRLIQTHPNEPYLFSMAPLYATFGPSQILGRVSTAVVGTVTVFLMYAIGRRIFGRRAALVGASFFALLPNVVELQGEMLRDTFVLFAMLLAIERIFSGGLRKLNGMLVVAMALILLYTMRGAAFLVVAVSLASAGLVVLWAWQERRLRARDHGNRWRAIRRHVVAAGLVGLVGAIAWALLLAWPELVPGYAFHPDDLSHTRRVWGTGGSAYLEGREFHSHLDMFAFLPIGALFFLFTPFPWQVHNAFAAASLAENLLWLYPAALLALPGAWAARRDKRALTLLWLLLVGALGFGLVEGNIGTAIRHRVQFVWILFVFAGPTLAARFSSDLPSWWPRRLGLRRARGAPAAGDAPPSTPPPATASEPTNPTSPAGPASPETGEESRAPAAAAPLDSDRFARSRTMGPEFAPRPPSQRPVPAAVHPAPSEGHEMQGPTPPQ